MKLVLTSALIGRIGRRIVKISPMPLGIPPQSRQTRSAEADALRATLSAPSTTKHRSHAFHAIAAFDFKSRASVSASRHINAHRIRRANLRSARFERTPPHHERLQRVRKGAHGVRRTCGADAGADLDRALS